MRKQVMSLAANKRLLNCFAYTGAFSVYALAGGAEFVLSLDSSAQALELAKKNVASNGFLGDRHTCLQGDVFDFLNKDPLDYDFVILDPPAFAKGKKDVVAACRGYKELNRTAIKKMPKNSYLLTCSCSQYIDENLFQQVIFQAAAETHHSVKIIGRHQMALDHPVNIFHPESEYLKSLLLYFS